MPKSQESPARLLVCATGAAAAMTIPQDLIALRRQLDCRVTVVLSRAATRFLQAEAIRHIADQVIDGSNDTEVFAVGHMKLAMQADLITIMPATAATLAACAHGLAHDIIPTIVLAAAPPVLFLPSMNKAMWLNPATQRNIALLRSDGHDVRDPSWERTLELADHTFEEHPGLPSTAEIVELVRDRLQGRRTREG